MDEMKKYRVIVGDVHDYNIIVTPLKDDIVDYSIFTSNGEQWVEKAKNTKCVTVIEDDLDYKIDTCGDVDASDIHTLRILLNFIYEGDEIEMIEHKIVKKF